MPVIYIASLAYTVLAWCVCIRSNQVISDMVSWPLNLTHGQWCLPFYQALCTSEREERKDNSSAHFMLDMLNINDKLINQSRWYSH